MELVHDRATRAPLRRATEKYERTIVGDIAEYLLRERDIYVPSDKFGLWIVPPLVATRDELDWVCAALDDALGQADRMLGGATATKATIATTPAGGAGGRRGKATGRPRRNGGSLR
jgi:hypothetical protein